MNYCISGRNGFIGTAIAEYLTARGHYVKGIPRGLTIGGLMDYFRLIQPDCIIHLASYGNHYDQKDPVKMVETNIIGTYNILEAAKNDCKLIYNVSTSSVLLKDQTLYSATKLCAEQIARMYKNVVNVRPYSVYGPGEAVHRLIPTVIECLNSGRQMILDENATHWWIYIDDFARCLFAGVTEIGGKEKVSNLEIVRILENISGKKLNYMPGKLRSYDTDDWTTPNGICYTSLFEGLKLTYEYYIRKDY